MKYLTYLMLCSMITGCGTIGGAMQGAGDDLGRVGSYVRSVGK